MGEPHIKPRLNPGSVASHSDDALPAGGESASKPARGSVPNSPVAAPHAVTLIATATSTHEFPSPVSPPPAHSSLVDEAQTAAAPEEVVLQESASPDRSAAAVGAGEPFQRRQSTALTILATLAVLYTMAAAQAILFPITLALLFALTLRPVVRGLERKGISPLVTSLGLLVVVMGSLTAGVMGMIEPAQTWIEEAPSRMQVVGEKLSGLRTRLQELAHFSERLENIATGATTTETTTAAEPGESPVWERLRKVFPSAEKAPDLREPAGSPVAVEVRQPRLIANLSVLNSAGNAVGMMMITLVLGFFLLWEGDTLLNNVLGTLPRFRDKKNVVRLVQNVERGISRYLLTVTLINMGLGFAIGSALWLLGVPNPALWGLMATVLNFIPFLGALLGVVVIFLVSVFSFDSLAYATIPPLVYFALNAMEGNFITPALIGRSVSLNSVAVFVALVLWGWLWGIGGALIGVPLLIIFKLVCDQFEKTAPIGALLEGRHHVE